MSSQEYLDWVKNEIDKHCNGDKLFETYWEHDDEVPVDELCEAISRYRDEGYASPQAYLEGHLLAEMASNGYDPFAELVRLDGDDVPDEIYDEVDSAISGGTIYGDLDACGYRGIDMRVDDLLDRREYNIELCLATPAEADGAFSSIVDAYGSSAHGPDVDCLDPSDLDNALTYLIHQQGYPVRRVYDDLVLGADPASPFVGDIACECRNNIGSEYYSELVAAVSVSGTELLDLVGRMGKPDGFIKLPQDVGLGLHNEWSGAGALTGILLEKPFVFPASMLDHLIVEGATRSSHNGSPRIDRDGSVSRCWSVDDVCGLTGEFWDAMLAYTDEAPELASEDLERTLADVVDALSAARAEEKADEARETIEAFERGEVDYGRMALLEMEGAIHRCADGRFVPNVTSAVRFGASLKSTSLRAAGEQCAEASSASAPASSTRQTTDREV